MGYKLCVSYDLSQYIPVTRYNIPVSPRVPSVNSSPFLNIELSPYGEYFSIQYEGYEMEEITVIG